MNALIEEFTTKQNQRFLNFLRQNTQNPNLSQEFVMTSLEAEVEEAPIHEIKEDKDKLEYIKYEKEEGGKYSHYDQESKLEKRQFNQEDQACLCLTR